MEVNYNGLMLRAFAEALRLGSISRASISLSRSQPMVTQLINRLEDVVGERLLIRSAKGVIPTEAGQQFLPYALRILELSDASVTHLQKSPARHGSLRRIGLGEDLAGENVLKSVLNMSSNPKIAIQVLTPEQKPKPEDCMHGEIDLFFGDPFPKESAAMLPSRIGRTQLIWAAAPEFDPSVRPLPVALYPPACPWRGQIIDVLSKNLTDWFVMFESGSLAALQASARSGLALIACLRPSLGVGLVEVDAQAAGLPQPPEVELALYRSPKRNSEYLLDQIESVLWRAVVK